MKPEEAVTVVEMLVYNWPGPHWSVPVMESYARHIEPLDCELVMKAVIRAVNELEFYPKVAVLREFVRIEKRLAEPDGPIERMLNDTPSAILPAWVRGWCVSRARYDDFRVWAEQCVEMPLDPDDELMPQEARDRYILEGAELRIQDIFASVIA